jgi:hypothetical protein
MEPLALDRSFMRPFRRGYGVLPIDNAGIGVLRLSNTQGRPKTNDMASKRSVEFSERMPASKAALHLELIASGLRSPSAYLDPRDLSLEFQLPAEVNLEMTVKIRPKKSRGKLSIELTWSLEDDAQADDSPIILSDDE